MAIIKFTQDKGAGIDGVNLVTWGPMANGDVGAAYQYNDVAFDKMIQVDGTFGVGGTMVVEGSVDGTNWTTMKDNTAANLAITSLLVRNIFDAPLFYRVRVSGGDGTTSLRGIILLRRQLYRVY